MPKQGTGKLKRDNMEKLFKYLWNDMPSLWLLYIFIVFAIYYAPSDIGVTALLGIAAMYIIYNTINKGRLFSDLDKVMTTEQKLYMGMPVRSTRSKPTVFDIVGYVLLAAGGVFVAGGLVYTLFVK